MSRRKPKRKPVLDPENGILTMPLPDGHDLTMAFIGLDTPIVFRLAMVGALQMVSKRRNPAQAWSLIQQGIFGRDTRNRRIPMAVRAIAQIRSISEDAAWKLWKALSRDDRARVKKEPAVQAVIASLRADRLAAGSNGEPLAWLK